MAPTRSTTRWREEQEGDNHVTTTILEKLDQLRGEIQTVRLRLSRAVDLYVEKRAEDPDWAKRSPFEGTKEQLLFPVAEWAVVSTSRYLNELIEEERKLTEDLTTGDTV
jgi:hypothetical protein